MSESGIFQTGRNFMIHLFKKTCPLNQLWEVSQSWLSGLYISHCWEGERSQWYLALHKFVDKFPVILGQWLAGLVWLAGPTVDCVVSLGDALGWQTGKLELFKLVETRLLHLAAPQSYQDIVISLNSHAKLLLWGVNTSQLTSCLHTTCRQEDQVITFHLGLKSKNIRDYLLVYYQCGVICAREWRPGYNYDCLLSDVWSEDLQVVNQEKTTNYRPGRDNGQTMRIINKTEIMDR